jgi:hypothetical protein
VSIDDGPFAVWLANTTLTSAAYIGEPNRRYAFYSVATDNAGQSELAPTLPDSTTTTGNGPLAGDFNNDRQVDLRDLMILQNHFGIASGASPAEGDMNGDGAINRADVALFARMFGSKAPASSPSAQSPNVAAASAVRDVRDRVFAEDIAPSAGIAVRRRSSGRVLFDDVVRDRALVSDVGASLKANRIARSARPVAINDDAGEVKSQMPRRERR